MHSADRNRAPAPLDTSISTIGLVSDASSHASTSMCPTLLGGGGISAPGSYPLAVAEEDVREGHKGERHEGDEARGPLKPKSLIHLHAEERERRCAHTVSNVVSPSQPEGESAKG